MRLYMSAIIILRFEFLLTKWTAPTISTSTSNTVDELVTRLAALGQVVASGTVPEGELKLLTAQLATWEAHFTDKTDK